MINEQLSKKVSVAAKWSTLTEVTAKLVSPITNMILARLLVPEAFGVVATITMIVSFAEMFADAGFQKYLIQREFKNEKEKHNNTNVAFWTNLGIAILLWGFIALFSDSISNLVGNPGLGLVISIACIQLPLTSFSSIQIALYKRDFDFKTLFIVRILSVFIPFIVTIPLAFLGLSYWALIIGNVCGQLINAIILIIRSKWKPTFYYKFKILKEMFSFSIWSLIESLAIWLTAWIDVMIIGNALGAYELGLYKTSQGMVNAIMAIVTASVIPILFSTLSRLQNDDKSFKKMFYKAQKIVAYLVLPLGIGLFIYSDEATQLLLGNNWSEASDIIGIWALTSVFLIITSHFNSEVYRAKGKPKISFITQMIHLLFLVPTCLISLKYGFWILVYSRALIRFQGVITGLIIMKYVMGFPVLKTIENIAKPIICTILMGGTAVILKQVSNSMLWTFISIAICMLIYGVLFITIGKSDVRLFKTLLKRKS